MKKSNLIIGIISIIASIGMAFGISSDFASFIADPILFVSASGLTAVIGGMGVFSLVTHFKDRKRIIKAGEQLIEITKEFRPEDTNSFDQEKVLQKAKEAGYQEIIDFHEKLGGFNPYSFVAVWHMNYLLDETFSDPKSCDITYKIIKDMKQSGYTNDEIAEYFMMEMAEYYSCNKALKNKTLEKKLVVDSFK